LGLCWVTRSRSLPSDALTLGMRIYTKRQAKVQPLPRVGPLFSRCHMWASGDESVLRLADLAEAPPPVAKGITHGGGCEIHETCGVVIKRALPRAIRMERTVSAS